MTDICRQAMVEGRVQGVCFRVSTREQARRLGITGWARNLPDGQVEVLMCGSERAVEQLQQWLSQGPPLAIVERVESRVAEWQELDDFTIG